MRVLIVDDHPLYREGLKALLSGLDPDVETVDAADVAEAEGLAGAAPGFDLILLDMNLPGLNRLAALQRMKAAFEAACLVVVSAEEDPALILQAIDAGAAGYIPKNTDVAVTIRALQLVLAHGIFVPAHALRSMGGPCGSPAPAPERLPEFSERQRAVLRGLLQGKPNKVIARELDVAEGTVKAHLWAVYQLLGVSTRTQAMCRVHELGLLDQLLPR